MYVYVCVFTCMCVHACMYVCMQVCMWYVSIYVYVCMFVCICTYVCMHACKFVYIYMHAVCSMPSSSIALLLVLACVYVCMYACMYVCVQAFIRTYVCMYIYVCMYKCMYVGGGGFSQKPAETKEELKNSVTFFSLKSAGRFETCFFAPRDSQSYTCTFWGFTFFAWRLCMLYCKSWRATLDLQTSFCEWATNCMAHVQKH